MTAKLLLSLNFLLKFFKIIPKYYYGAEKKSDEREEIFYAFPNNLKF